MLSLSALIQIQFGCSESSMTLPAQLPKTT